VREQNKINAEETSSLCFIRFNYHVSSLYGAVYNAKRSRSASDRLDCPCWPIYSINQWEKTEINGWDFGDLPLQIPLRGNHGLIGYAYPALTVADGSINLRLFSVEKQSVFHHQRGVAALYYIHFADLLKQLKKNVALTPARKTLVANIGNPKQLEQSIVSRVKKDLFFKPWRKREEFLDDADSVRPKILPYGQQVLMAIEPVLKAFDDTYNIITKLMTKNKSNQPVLSFLKETHTELRTLVPVDFPELYTLDRMKALPRYCKALALRAERGSLNLVAARKKLQNVLIYSQKLQQMINDLVQPSHFDLAVSKNKPSSPKDSTEPMPVGIQEIIPFKEDVTVDCPQEKKVLIEKFFWMIEEYKVSLFAQELKTPYPVSPKKLNQLMEEIEKL